MVERSKVFTSIVLALALLFLRGTALARPTPGEICAAAKQKATGVKAAKKLNCHSKYTKSGGTFDLAACLQQAEAKFATAFEKAEHNAKGVSRGCLTEGDAAAIESLVDDFVAAAVAALPAAPPATPTLEPTVTPTPLKSDGAACTSNSQCSNSHCLPSGGGSLCCHTACADTGPAACGNNGRCALNGAACELYSSTTVCSGPSCSGGMFTASANCNGAGSCGSGAPSACANNLACASAVSCAASCTPGTTSSCASPSFTCNAAGTACE